MRATRWLLAYPVAPAAALFVLWAALHLDGASWDYDEGAHAFGAWLVFRGHPLYTETFAAYTPGYLMAVVAGYSLLGATLTSARFVTVLLAAVGLLGTAVIAQMLAPRYKAVAGLSAALLLFVTPQFFQWSRAAMSDLPSGALMALSIALALGYLRDGRVRFLLIGEIVLAATLWVKLVAVGGVAGFGVIVLAGLLRHRTTWRLAVLGSLVVGLLSLAPLLAFDVPAMLDQAIWFHVRKRAAYGDDLAGNLAALAQFLGANLWLVVPSLWAVAASIWRGRTERVTLAAIVLWFAAGFVTLAWQSPLFPSHHPVVLVFPLAALAGAGVAHIADDLAAGRTALRATSALVALAVLATLIGLPDRLAAVIAPPAQPDAEEAIGLLRAVTPSTDLLVSDAQVIALRAERESPPAFADTSSARLVSGSLTPQTLIDGARASGANGVLFWSGRLETAEPFGAWVQDNFHLVRSAFQKPVSPYRLYLRDAHPQFPQAARIGDGIGFAGFDLNRRSGARIAAGQILSVTLYFQRIGPIDRAYTVFAHLLAPDGHLVVQEDRPPLQGRYATNDWKPGEWIIDEYAMALDADLPPGEYRLAVGMYAPDRLKRLPAYRSDGTRYENDAVVLGLPVMP